MKIEIDSRGEGHTSVVVGLGKTGLACARYLHGIGDRVIVVDSRERPPGLADLRRGLPDVETRLGGFDEGVLSLADRLVVSPGVPMNEPFVLAATRRKLPVLGDIELFAQATDVPVIGVTGSNGKSTVTRLIAAMLREAGSKVMTGGNIGVPALDLLRQSAPDFFVLELSSFQLERTNSLHCRIAVILNLCRDHLDHHESMDEYAAAKARIFADCDVAVYNRDDAAVAAMPGVAQPKISFGLGVPPAGQFGVIARRKTEWLARGARLLMPASKLRLFGRHNVANVLAALAIGDALSVQREPMLRAAQVFRGLPHRTQWIDEIDGVTWINDSKGTNVGAAVAAVESVTGSLVLIAGGDAKGADFEALAGALSGRARGAVLLGKDAPVLERWIAPVCPVQTVATMDEAVEAAAQAAQPGDTVLLSPACSSLDMFANYEARGRAFATAVGRLAR